MCLRELRSFAALKTLTRTIPDVFALAIDPVGIGFVESLLCPGGNLTRRLIG